MMLQLNPPLQVITPLGEAVAHFIESEADTVYFGVFQKETGENWWWENRLIRLMACLSDGRYETTPIKPSLGLAKALSRHKRR